MRGDLSNGPTAVNLEKDADAARQIIPANMTGNPLPHPAASRLNQATDVLKDLSLGNLRDFSAPQIEAVKNACLGLGHKTAEVLRAIDQAMSHRKQVDAAENARKWKDEAQHKDREIEQLKKRLQQSEESRQRKATRNARLRKALERETCERQGLLEFRERVLGVIKTDPRAQGNAQDSDSGITDETDDDEGDEVEM